MPWNDQIFEARLTEAARTRGKTVRQALIEAGLSEENFSRRPKTGRRIDMFEKLAPVVGWSDRDLLHLIAECMGWLAPTVDGRGNELVSRLLLPEIMSELVKARANADAHKDKIESLSDTEVRRQVVEDMLRQVQEVIARIEETRALVGVVERRLEERERALKDLT